MMMSLLFFAKLPAICLKRSCTSNLGKRITYQKKKLGNCFKNTCLPIRDPPFPNPPARKIGGFTGAHQVFFYNYSYASGLLISKSMQARYAEDHSFMEKVKEFLSAGTSDSPKNIFKNMGVDITNKNSG